MNANRSRVWCRAAWVCLALFVAGLASLTPEFLQGSTGLVKLRNSLLVDAVDWRADWRPEQTPADFQRDVPARVDPFFAAQVAALRLDQLPSDWERARAIARRLLTGRAELLGGAVQSDLRSTYDAITKEGRGYCADFTRSFTALAVAAGLPVRSWAFSFDGFGGHGHVWVEIWDRAEQRWILLDVFDNYYFTAGGAALSALDLRAALLRNEPQLRLNLIAPEARPGYEIEAKAWDYFRRGLPQWYLWWGSNVYAYDADPMVRSLAPLGRSAEQLGATVSGVHPHIRILGDAQNTAEVQAIQGLKARLHLLAVLMPLLVMLGGFAFWRCRKGRRA
ncbi:MAG TPA: transglutaminase-like domain-containing protein [Burkholderiaceae bacterium]